MKGHGTIIITVITKTVVSLIESTFVDDTDLVTAANNAPTSGETIIKQRQALITDWCDRIRTTGGLIAQTKTR